MPAAMPDLLILGGGAAGLMAAGDLAAARRTVVLLEAQRRIGGRIHPTGPFDALPVELGAEFVHELSPDVERLLAGAGVLLLEGEGETRHVVGRSLRPLDEFWEHVEKRLSSLRAPRGRDRPIAALLGAPRTARDRFVYRFVEGFNAASADELSAQALLESHRRTMEEGGYQSYRPEGGTAALLRALLARLDPRRVRIECEAPVAAVEWRRGRAIAIVRRRGRAPRRFSARALLVTLPAPVLALEPGRPGSLRFVPDLPQKRRAAAAIGVGDVVKVVVQLRGTLAEPRFVERRPELEGAQFLHVDNAAFPTWWTSFPVRSTLLTAWAGGPSAAALAGASHARRVALALDGLARILGVPRARVSREVVHAWTHDWRRDPFARGAYSFPRVGEREAPARLASPVDDTLFFAGEATDPEGIGGTIGSALASGARAAREALRALRRH
jgi:monoamine oxidase